MAARLNPYLSFTNQAREALNFYAGIFGGSPTISTFAEFGMPDPAFGSLVMHGQLETDLGFTLMASDTPPGMPEVVTGNSITVSLSGDEPVLADYFAKLAEGGQVTMPLARQMWGDDFGQLTDKFGVAWLVNIAGNAN